MNIIGYHIQPNKIISSYGEITESPPWLNILFTHSDNNIKILYHMDYSVACLLKMLKIPTKALKQLAKTEDLQYEEYTFQYIPDVWFSIKDNNNKLWCGFSNASQYTDNRLDNLPDTFLLALKAQQVGEDVYNTLIDIHLSPKSLTSPISVFNKEILSQLDLPTIDDIPDEAAWYAYQCCRGTWTEAFKIGHFQEAWDYDIRSAYGAEIAKLIDSRLGTWSKSDTYNHAAKYGYCKCTGEITADFSPLIYNHLTPKGTIEEVFMTKTTYDFIHRHNLGYFTITDAWWWIPERLTFPLSKIASDLFHEKERSNGLKADIIKRIISGIWGKMLETHSGGFGKLYNPCWGAEVETNVRLKVAGAIINNNSQNNLISITVDGMTTTQPLLLLSCGAMGSWKLVSHSPVVVIGSGQQAVQYRPRQGQFALRYEWIEEEIAKNPKAKEYYIHGTSPVTLLKATISNKLKDLGKLEKSHRTIDITSEHKRNYRQEPKNGGDLWTKQYNSTPWDTSFCQEER